MPRTTGQSVKTELDTIAAALDEAVDAAAMLLLMQQFNAIIRNKGKMDALCSYVVNDSSQIVRVFEILQQFNSKYCTLKGQLELGTKPSPELVELSNLIKKINDRVFGDGVHLFGHDFHRFLKFNPEWSLDLVDRFCKDNTITNGIKFNIIHKMLDALPVANRAQLREFFHAKVKTDTLAVDAKQLDNILKAFSSFNHSRKEFSIKSLDKYYGIAISPAVVVLSFKSEAPGGAMYSQCPFSARFGNTIMSPGEWDKDKRCRLESVLKERDESFETKGAKGLANSFLRTLGLGRVFKKDTKAQESAVVKQTKAPEYKYSRVLMDPKACLTAVQGQTAAQGQTPAQDKTAAQDQTAGQGQSSSIDISSHAYGTNSIMPPLPAASSNPPASSLVQKGGGSVLFGNGVALSSPNGTGDTQGDHLTYSQNP